MKNRQQKFKDQKVAVATDSVVDFLLYENTPNQRNFCCSHRNSHSADVHTQTHTLTQGLVSIFRASSGIWSLNLAGHFVKQISVCWKTVKTCCPCVSISAHVYVGRFIFSRILNVRAERGSLNSVNFL